MELVEPQQKIKTYIKTKTNSNAVSEDNSVFTLFWFGVIGQGREKEWWWCARPEVEFKPRKLTELYIYHKIAMKNSKVL